MRTCHGALLLAVAMVLLSTGICTAPVPALGPGLNKFSPEYAPAPGPGLDEFLPEYAPAPGPGLNELPPEYAPAPGLGLDEFPSEYAPVPGPGLYSCSKILYSSGCHAQSCLDKCYSQLKGDGLCIQKACKCSYKCKKPAHLGI
ncbi:hypothetical protein BAE44_0006635 [Dichanthelium oligosanthes]|uniref:Knottin scorpion toxin-like domain-containing protein n=1 Tax=Dichanthelium oligosanthes TaxID=888268 RepID=A0A1E5W4S4_9POAL|nr:hypothetical protein BAE44_0006635 [Dichanthelium oligosanthes]